MNDEKSEEQVPDPEQADEVEPVETEPQPGAEPEIPPEEGSPDEDAEEPPPRSAAPPAGLPRTTTTGDPDRDVRKPGAGAVDEGDALDRERDGEDVRGHPEDHGTLLPD